MGTMPPAIDVHRLQVRNRLSMSYGPPGAGVISGDADLPVMTHFNRRQLLNALAHGPTSIPGRLDVLVHAKKIRRVVFRLQGDEALVLRRRVGFADPVFPLVSEIVHVDGVGQKRLHRVP